MVAVAAAVVIMITFVIMVGAVVLEVVEARTAAGQYWRYSGAHDKQEQGKHRR
jgi:hypothetical protein